MTARYLVRLDDACPTMRREIWDPLEDGLRVHGIKPIVGVIPENRDPQLHCSPADAEFWHRVRRWQRDGWSIAMHGLHHLYRAVTKDAKPLLPTDGETEFVGVPLAVQRDMIRQATEIFTAKGIKPDLFMAPAHSLDANTLLALEAETEVRTISDGHSFSAYREHGFVWIPQQIWRFRRLPAGLWTVCLHPNTMTREDLDSLLAALPKYRPVIMGLTEVQQGLVRERNLLNRFAARLYAFLLDHKRRRQ